MATGTLPIIRPLLAFPKSDLLATCATHKIPFVSDPTNFDPTLTPRNAIRSLLAQQKLPRALREGSVLGLMGASRRLIRTAERESETLLRLCEVGGFVPETGVVGVRFPSLASCGDSVGKGEGEGEGEGQGDAAVERSVQTQIQALALRRITELVSPFPDNHFPLRAFEPFVARVFRGKQAQEQEQSFTLGGVLFQPLSLAPKKKGEESLFLRAAAAHAHGSDTPKNSSSNNQKTWLLSRQPYMKNRLPVLDFHLCTEGSVTTTERQEQEQEQWHLWDNRYWLRVGWSSSSSSSIPSKSIPNPNSNPNPGISSQNPEPPKIHLRIRPLQKSDLNILRQLSPTHTAHHHDPSKHANKTDGEHILARMETKTGTDCHTNTDGDTDNVQDGNQQGRIADPQALTRLLAQVSPGRTRFTIPVLVQVLVRQQQQQPTNTTRDDVEGVDGEGVVQSDLVSNSHSHSHSHADSDSDPEKVGAWAVAVSDTTTTTTTHTHATISTSTSTTQPPPPTSSTATNTTPTSPPSPSQSPNQLSRSQQGWNTPKTQAPPLPPPPPPPPPAAEEEEIPLALPTLDLWLPSSPVTQHQRKWPEGKSLRWEWRYKMVDRAGTLRLMGWETEGEGEGEE
ncbi:hypothetical protein ASPACDRAFT_121431 [Aspergillus aculeatus ATCC 16872]|uniref:tRNA(Ile)-lysidine/2-thiocytidine synthase N-terminal domain-containing protein n=1 Tax=Aspergillus aculeatus (strain ATCC 16872 / CBS 172.66 / WB 5094) TaxID=690307 RepID=A0A1L9WRI2_ASPA1|nr:uncharacterized protein ASPACDRAFT_121431 [Aspergillus aculeatus ATCC 16872]OJJ98786.1 hypothetical protein ASPACDRAFT_121431 [Aspergillus aculeatus ATCC 16872]